MKMEPTGHSNPVTGSTIAFAKTVASARNSFSSLRTLDTEGTVDAGEWRPGAGCCVSNVLLLPQDRRPIPRRDACLDQKCQELLVVGKEDQSATGTTKGSATPDERYLVSGARLNIYTFSPQNKLKEFDGMSFARQLLYAQQQQSLKTGIESKIQDGVQDHCFRNAVTTLGRERDAILRGQVQPPPRTRRRMEGSRYPHGD